MHLHLASAAERLEAFANVYDVWKWGSSLEEHVRRRCESVQHARAIWYVGCLDGRVVTSLGCYPLQFRLRGQALPGFAIGSVHTLPEFRGQGLAPRLIEFVEQERQAAGDALALLYSDIGTTYYERLGYRACPSLCGWRELAGNVPEAAWRVEPQTLGAAAIEELAEYYSADHGGAAICIERPAEYWDYLRRKGPEDFLGWLVDAAGQRRGYVRCKAVADAWRIVDLALPQRGRNLAEAYAAAAACAAARGVQKLGGWLPADAQTARFFALRPREREITMLKPLENVAWDEEILQSAQAFCEIDHV